VGQAAPGTVRSEAILSNSVVDNRPVVVGKSLRESKLCNREPGLKDASNRGSDKLLESRDW